MGDHFGVSILVPFLAPTLVPFLVPNVQKSNSGGQSWEPSLVPRNVVLDLQNGLCSRVSIWTDVGNTPIHPGPRNALLCGAMFWNQFFREPSRIAVCCCCASGKTYLRSPTTCSGRNAAEATLVVRGPCSSAWTRPRYVSTMDSKRV